MQLLIWTEDYPSVVRKNLSAGLRHTEGVGIQIHAQPPMLGQMPPTAILALGTKPKDELAAAKLIPKNRTLTTLRNTLYRYHDIPLIFSYSAGVIDIDYGKHVDLLTDLSAAIRLAKTGSLEPQLGKYRYVKDFSEALAAINCQYQHTKKPVDVVLDLETVGLDPYLLPTQQHPGAFIVTIQLSYRPGMADVVYFTSKHDFNQWLQQYKPQLEWLLNHEAVSLGGANLKFDLHWLAVHAGLECTNFKFDSTLVGSLLDENRSNGLDIHAKVYVPSLGGYSDTFDKTIDKSRMDLVPRETLLPYAGGDTDAGLQVRQAQRAELIQDPQLARFYITILHPASRAIEMIERGGVLVDITAYKELESQLNTEIDTLIEKSKKILGGRVVAKHQDLSKRGGLNLTKASLLTDFMFSPMGLNLKPLEFTEGSAKLEDKKPSTALDHLLKFKDVPEAKEFVTLLKEFSSATKTLTTYVHGFQKHLRSDGRFHPSYWLFAGNKDTGDGGTVTGRLSAKDPAFQTLSKHTKWAKLLRKCFIAPEGYLVLENDFSQGELKVIACVANEPTMISAYLNNQDLHALTSGRFSGYDYEAMMALKKSNPDLYDSIRQLGKAGNFGLVYGMSAGGFESYAELNYGVKLKPGEAGAFRDGFFATYSQLPAYHEAMKQHARMHGFVRSPLGRIRHLPLINSRNSGVKAQAERQAINSPIQSTLSDMMIWAIALAHKRGWGAECPAFGIVHDAKYTYIPEDNYQMYAAREIEIMENLPFEQVGWAPQLKFTADGKVGPNMADLKKL